MAPRIAYFINQYPKVSHTFIRREIASMERLGFQIDRIALRGWDATLVDEEDRREQARTRYLLRQGVRPLLASALCVALRSPIRFAKALAIAFCMARRSERSLPFHLGYLAEACHLASLLRASRAIHVHAHFGTNSAEVVMLARILGGPTYSFTVHGPEEFDKAPLLSLHVKSAAAEFVVAVSSYGRSQLMRCLRREDWKKIQIVHCGLETPMLNAASRPPGRLRFVCVGRICEQKGHLLLIEATARLAAKRRDFDLVLVGDGELRHEVQALIDARGLTHQVRLTGWLGSDRVREELLEARALVLPSFAEGLPVVIMEAMAARRPVVATYIAGIPELVVSGETGWLVPPGDIDALAIAMEGVLNCPEQQLIDMGDKAHARVVERHSIEREAAKLGILIRAATTV